MTSMQFNHLNLMITDTCPLQCAHCCVESGPWRTTSMPLEDAVSYVRQAHAINPRTVLSFTGGEPFVRFPLMRDIAREAHALGMQHTTITSAVWCKTQEFAREKLAALRACGLTTISISYDSFHEPWVAPERVRNCVAAGVELGVRVVVGGAITRDARGARALLSDWLDAYPEVYVRDDPVDPTGRAALIPLESLLMEERSRPNLACPMTADLLIEVDGSAYPCCSTGGDYAYLKLGNARETPLAELRVRVEDALWFRVIGRQGFGVLEEIVRRYHPDAAFPTRFTSVCHLCRLVFGEGELGAKVRDALARHAAREAATTQISLVLWDQLRAALARQ